MFIFSSSFQKKPLFLMIFFFVLKPKLVNLLKNTGVIFNKKNGTRQTMTVTQEKGQAIINHFNCSFVNRNWGLFFKNTESCKFV